MHPRIVVGAPRCRLRSPGARLQRRILEVDPLPCAACGSEMKIVSVITEPDVAPPGCRTARYGRPSLLAAGWSVAEAGGQIMTASGAGGR